MSACPSALLIKERNTSTYPYTACRYWFTFVESPCCTPDQSTTCGTTRPVART
ncbi:hypothetical protein HMPREF1591_00988 [Escherichia coli 113303]|nr:hypothetical protein HMPREF1591_00988 [Escherichia coli 113303]